LTSHLQTPAGKLRARSLGVPFTGTPGEWNAITDVPGVEVGYRTLIEAESVRTGVTAIHPRGRDRSADPCAAGVFALNGNGEMTGLSWIEESGTVAWPVTITNTHAVGIAHEATIHWAVRRFSELGELWLLPVAAETYDGYLNDINGGHVTRQVVIDAIEAADTGPIEEGSVGGGTGMNCYAFKGGSGTASRVVDLGDARYKVGAFLQCNFGKRAALTIAGRPLDAELADDNPIEESYRAQPGAGSVIGVMPPMHRCCPASATHWHGGCRWDWPAPAPADRTSRATCSWPFRPPTRARSTPAFRTAIPPRRRCGSCPGSGWTTSTRLSWKPSRRPP
jgi:D-aminopeptidase